MLSIYINQYGSAGLDRNAGAALGPYYRNLDMGLGMPIACLAMCVYLVLISLALMGEAGGASANKGNQAVRTGQDPPFRRRRSIHLRL